jgi:hypothetical protein
MNIALCLLLTVAIGLVHAQSTTVIDPTTTEASTTTADAGTTTDSTVAAVTETSAAVSLSLVESTTSSCLLEQSLMILTCLPAKCINPANTNSTSPEYCPCVTEVSKCARDSGCIIPYNATAVDECRSLCPTLPVADCDPRPAGTSTTIGTTTGATSTGAASTLGVALAIVAMVMAIA